MKKLNYRQVFAFTNKPGYGNPAGVVWDASSLSDSEMQEIARINNLSETAFLFPTGDLKIPYEIKFFTPAKSIPMCGHASIASAFVYWKICGCPQNIAYSQKAEVGVLDISIIAEGGIPKIYLGMDNPSLSADYNAHRNTIAEALGICMDNIRDDFPVMINEREYLYIPIKELKTIQEMKPDFKRMLEVDRKLKIHGWYVFTGETLYDTSDFHCRFFVPSYGVNEDPVTGTANAYFTEYYSKFIGGGNSYTLKVEQGFEINKNGIIEITAACGSQGKSCVKIGGTAVSYIEGVIYI